VCPSIVGPGWVQRPTSVGLRQLLACAQAGQHGCGFLTGTDFCSRQERWRWLFKNSVRGQVKLGVKQATVCVAMLCSGRQGAYQVRPPPKWPLHLFSAPHLPPPTHHEHLHHVQMGGG